VGLLLPTSAAVGLTVDPGRVVAAAQRAEESGFDGVYTGDHIVHPRPLLESVVTLSVAIARTRSITLGPCVMLISLRQVAVLAKQLATLDTFAGGRLRLGIGVGGEYPGEWEACGVPMAERGRRTDEAIAQLRLLLGGEPATDGAYSHRGGVVISPPAAHRVPMLLAGRRPTALRRAAHVGDGWIGYLHSSTAFSRAPSWLLAERRRAGLTAAFTTGMLIPVQVDDEDDGARERAAAGWSEITANGSTFSPQHMVAGRPETMVDQLAAFVERGCDELVLGPVRHGSGFEQQLERLARDVLPMLHQRYAVARPEPV
jgi:alkanesulfonate monooxygenase SsuD/methylene tetrahydromethanopterin reductase-like flavin-dependent oxidoreductase (luciferase family)